MILLLLSSYIYNTLIQPESTFHHQRRFPSLEFDNDLMFGESTRKRRDVQATVD